jgi:UDP-N-acetylmuramoyl-L-alanyl-D-glutamate--2,6-diaminopimelate ligase
VIIDYAHTPDALENIIGSFKALEAGRVVTLFGCGGDRDATKRPEMGEIAARLSDFVIVTSDNPRTEAPDKIIEHILEGMKGTKTPYIVIENRREAIGWALKNARPGDIILLAGKGHETYQIIGKEKFPFDEREIVGELLRAIK